MTVTKISFSKTLESSVHGAGVWVKIGIDAEVREGENISNAIEEARAIVEDAHQKHIPEQLAPKGDLYFNVTNGKEERL
jgi:hydroxymethylpyrimidine/phosphomethylpyrimidine kinase